MKDNCGPGMSCAGNCGGNCSGSYPAPEVEQADPGDECDCRYCAGGFGSGCDADGDGAGMQPNFERPERDVYAELEQYALGWTHGWDDHEKLYADPHELADDAKPRMSKRGLVNGALAATIIWATLAMFVLACPSQSFPTPTIHAGVGPFQMGYVADSARIELEQAWDTRNARQVERGYCIEPGDVTVDTAINHASVEWVVHHVHPPETVDHATPYSITFRCSDSAVASIHTHPPATCRNNVCALGGTDGAVCSVDEQDRMAAQHDAFMAIQCDRHAFVFYWPGRRG